MALREPLGDIGTYETALSPAAQRGQGLNYAVDFSEELEEDNDTVTNVVVTSNPDILSVGVIALQGNRAIAWFKVTAPDQPAQRVLTTFDALTAQQRNLVKSVYIQVART